MPFNDQQALLSLRRFFGQEDPSGNTDKDQQCLKFIRYLSDISGWEDKTINTSKTLGEIFESKYILAQTTKSLLKVDKSLSNKSTYKLTQRVEVEDELKEVVKMLQK